MNFSIQGDDILYRGVRMATINRAHISHTMMAEALDAILNPMTEKDCDDAYNEGFEAGKAEASADEELARDEGYDKGYADGKAEAE